MPRLLLITDRRGTGGRDLIEVVGRAIDGGVRFVCLREKDLPDEELLPLAKPIAAMLGGSGRFVVNGRPPVAAACGAGLHLPADVPVETLPVPRPFGRSVHGSRELAAALAEGVDYVVAGNVFATESKPGRPGRGLEWLRRTCVDAGTVPVYAIGGIERERVESVLAAGAFGVAVCSAILFADDPLTAARQLCDAVEGAARHLE